MIVKTAEPSEPIDEEATTVVPLLPSSEIFASAVRPLSAIVTRRDAVTVNL